MENNSNDLLDNTDLGLNSKRKTLLPWWIKTFAWIFLVMGIIAVVCLVIGLFVDNLSLAIYNLETTDIYSLSGLSIFMIYLLKGVTSYGLLFGKNWGVQLALADAVIGVLVCLATMFFNIGDSQGINFRLELLLLIPYLIKMIKIREEWERRVE
jgi:Mn2+/Fe2+ NRAMP family transporter